jgi:hypothetical protein
MVYVNHLKILLAVLLIVQQQLFIVGMVFVNIVLVKTVVVWIAKAQVIVAIIVGGVEMVHVIQVSHVVV